MKLKLAPLYIVYTIFSSIISTAQNPLANALSKFSNHSDLAVASYGIYAVNLKTNEVVLSKDENRLLAPASTTKLFSTALALDVLGGDYRPTTKIYYDGNINDSILKGDIWIIGGGDVSLGSKYFDSQNKTKFLEEWIQQIKKAGIAQIHGTIYVDGSKFGYEGVADDWLWGDLGNYYGTHFSGLTIYDNLVEYHFKTGAVGKAAELLYTVPELPTLEYKNGIISGNVTSDNSYLFGGSYSSFREGRGTLPANRADFTVKGSMPDPEQTLASELSRELLKNGMLHIGKAISTRVIQVNQPAATWTLITNHTGFTFREIAQKTNFHSINIYAESMMRITAFEKTGKGLNGDASIFMEKYWKEKLKATHLYLNDGSGLARTNAISAKTMVDLLVYMNQSPAQQDFYASLPVTGVSGTLKSLCANQAGHGRIHAKSGTMRRVKSYAGYVESRSGAKYAFAIIVNNYTCSTSQLVTHMESVMNALATH